MSRDEYQGVVQVLPKNLISTGRLVERRVGWSNFKARGIEIKMQFVRNMPTYHLSGM